MTTDPTRPINLPGAPLPISTATQPRHNDPLRHAAEQFESVFLTEMLGPMFEGLNTDGLGGGGVGEEMFRPMLIERYADAIVHNGGIGIADSITREMVRMQAAQENAAAAAQEGANQQPISTTEPADGAHR